MKPLDNNVRIEGQNIYLRPILEEDTDMVLRWRNSDRVMKNFIYRKPICRSEHLDWLHNKVEKGLVYQFIICDKHNSTPYGSIYLQNFEEQHHRAEEGIFLADDDKIEGRGIGTEAGRLIVDYSFYSLGLHKLTARVLAYNKASRRMHEKSGYLQEGYLKEELFLDGKYQDLVLYGAIHS